MANGTRLSADFPESVWNLNADAAVSTTVRSKRKSSVPHAVKQSVGPGSGEAKGRGRPGAQWAPVSQPGAPSHPLHWLSCQDGDGGFFRNAFITFAHSRNPADLARLRQPPLPFHICVYFRTICEFPHTQ